MSRQVVPRRRTLNCPLALIIRLKPPRYFSVKPGSKEGLSIIADNRRPKMLMSSRARAHEKSGRNHPAENARAGNKPAFCRVARDASFATGQRAAGIRPI